jgi:2-dehydro-3-deoxyphosphogluconate aldolase/(4S)-4-hydroxy-2-oxoglutarate aldolase
VRATSPGLSPEVIEAAHESGLEPLPGVFTPTELIRAIAAGARVVKVFPASCGGPSFLRALRGPFPDVPLVPTGGVRIDEIGAYLEAGATAVAVGSELVGRSAPTSDRELEWIAAQASRAVAATGVARSSGGDGQPTSAIPDPASVDTG